MSYLSESFKYVLVIDRFGISVDNAIDNNILILIIHFHHLRHLIFTSPHPLLFFLTKNFKKGLFIY